MASKRRMTFKGCIASFAGFYLVVSIWNPALAYDKRTAKIFLDNGIRQMQFGDTNGAFVTLKRAEELDPDNWYIQSNLGFLLDKMGRKVDALKYFEKAYTIDPSMLSSAMGLAGVYAYLHDYNRAINICRRFLAVNRRRDAFTVYKMLGYLYACDKQVTQSYACYSRALAEKPKDEESWKEAVVNIDSTGSPAETEAIIKEFLRRFPRSASKAKFTERLRLASFELERQRIRNSAMEKAIAAPAGDDLDSFLIFVGGNRSAVSEATIALVKEGLRKIPRLFVDQLRSAGYRVMITPYLTDAMPELVFDHPRGYAQIATWHNCNGTFSARKKWIVVGEKYINISTGREVVDADADRTVAHEFGHAYDYFLGNSGVENGNETYSNFSHSPRFEKAYERDAERIRERSLQEKLRYFLQPGDAGKEELFAQLFPAFYGGVMAPNSPEELFAGCFPTLLAEMKTALSTDLEYEKLYGKKIKNYR